MREQYMRLLARWEELNAELAQPETAADPARCGILLKERADLEERVHAWEAYQTLLIHIQDAEELSTHPEMAEMAADELRALTAERERQEEALRLLLVPKDPDDDRSVLLEIRAGAGGEEAALFGADLLRMYLRYAERQGFKAEPISESVTGLGGVKEAVIAVCGRGAWARLKYESGVHRVQRVPVTEANGKLQTSTCTVAVLPEAEAVDLEIDPKDLRIDVYRATGHGGQCINTTDSAVRITHLPTGLVVTCQDQKSQLRNREQAMKVLRSRLLEQTRLEKDAAYAEQRRSLVGTGDRSERVRSYHFVQGRVTDHRLGLTLYRIDEIMNGMLDPFITALREQEQQRRLQGSGLKP